ncbi:MAG: stage II sporulation protein M, partial [Clostridiales bacterium]|nr:stage II sporulation protein M [Clostridiales bacterium]
MKIGTGKVIRVSTNLVRVMKDYYRLVLLISLFIAGMLIGALTFKNSGSNISTLLTDMVIKQSAERTSQAAIVTFINSLLVNAAFVGIAFTMGMCCIGTPFIGLLPLIKGLGLGMVAGYFYNNDVAGILYYLL